VTGVQTCALPISPGEYDLALYFAPGDYTGGIIHPGLLYPTPTSPLRGEKLLGFPGSAYIIVERKAGHEFGVRYR